MGKIYGVQLFVMDLAMSSNVCASELMSLSSAQTLQNIKGTNHAVVARPICRIFLQFAKAIYVVREGNLKSFP